MRQYTHVWPHVEPFQSKQDDCEYWAYSTKLCASYNDVMNYSKNINISTAATYFYSEARSSASKLA